MKRPAQLAGRFSFVRRRPTGVEMDGFEPTTLQLAKLALYQLSYIPEPIREPSWIQTKLQLL